MQLRTSGVVVGILAVAWLGCASASEAAYSEYVSLLPGYSFPDRSLDTTGRGTSLTALYGRRFRERLSYEITVGGSIFETGNTGRTDFYQTALTADLVYDLRAGRGKSLTPFVVGGIGGAYDDFFPDGRDGMAFIAQAGLGVVTAPLWRNGLSLRLEGRYVRDSKEGGHGEPRVSLGFEIPLGRRERVVEYVPVKQLEIREVVREVPRQWSDLDADGVDDEHDKCPGTPHGLRVDAGGCAIVNQSIELRGVTFEFNQARLTPNAQAVLDVVARAFVGQPALRVEIAGHTDSVGAAAFNLGLSKRRAEAVSAYLITKGAAPTQLVAAGYGETQLLVDPDRSDQDRERNRRVELRVLAAAAPTGVVP